MCEDLDSTNKCIIWFSEEMLLNLIRNLIWMHKLRLIDPTRWHGCVLFFLFCFYCAQITKTWLEIHLRCFLIISMWELHVQPNVDAGKSDSDTDHILTVFTVALNTLTSFSLPTEAPKCRGQVRADWSSQNSSALCALSTQNVFKIKTKQNTSMSPPGLCRDWFVE